MSPVLSQYPHLPSWVFPAFELFSSVLVALAVSGWSSITGLVALGAFLAYNIATYQVPLPSQTYTLSSLMAFKLFGLAAYILITDMKTEIREIRIEKDEKGQEIERIGKPPSSLPLLRKLYWSLIYVVWNPRGLGHTTQVKGITPLPRELSTRWKFVLSRLKLVLWNYFLVDVAQVWMMDINPGPFRSLGEHHISVIGASQSQFQRWMNVGSYSLLLGAGMGMFTYLLAAIIVGVGLGEPQEYPDLLGDFKECYTMRKFWGESWHQLFRQMFTRWGKWVTGRLGCQPGTNASSYTQLYVAFTISALMHTAGDLMLFGRAGLGTSAPFFLMQAMAITLEDLAIWVGRRTIGQRSWMKWIGYAWVILWLRWSLARFYDPFFAVGFGMESSIPYRLISKIWNVSSGL